MHHMNAPYILWYSIPPQTHMGQWSPLLAIATRQLHLASLVVRHVSSPHTIRKIYQNIMPYAFLYYPNKLSADYWHPFVHNIHCIARHAIKGNKFLLASVSST